jgi:hypothetical protein
MNNYLKVFVTALAVIIAVVSLSYFSVKVQGHKEEGVGTITLIVNDTMTIAQFGEINSIPNPVLKNVFGLTSKNALQKNIHEFGLARQRLWEQS